MQSRTVYASVGTDNNAVGPVGWRLGGGKCFPLVLCTHEQFPWNHTCPSPGFQEEMAFDRLELQDMETSRCVASP